MSKSILSAQEIKTTNISDIYFCIDSTRRNQSVSARTNSLVFDLRQRGSVVSTDYTGLLTNDDILVNVIEMEIGDIFLPILTDYSFARENWTNTFNKPISSLPPLIKNTVDYPVGSLSQIPNNVISLEIKEGFPQVITTTDNTNIHFMFSTSVEGNYLHLRPLINKYIFTVPKQFQNTLSLQFKGPLAPLSFPNDILDGAIVKFHIFDPVQRVVEYDPTPGMPNLVGATDIFYSGVYDSINNRIYFVPTGVSGNIFGVLSTISNIFNTYPDDQVNPIPGIIAPYEGGAYVTNRIYWAPFGMSNQSIWHYTDTFSNTMKTYVNNSGYTPPIDAFSSAYATPDGRRVYFVPHQPLEKLIYIEVATNNVVAFNNTKFNEMVPNAYDDGVMTENGLLYFIPFRQQNETTLHYLNTNNNIVYSYRNASALINPYNPPLVPPPPAVIPLFRGGVLNADGTKLYFVPSTQAGEDTWYYLDISKNTLVPFTNNSVPKPATGQTSYNGGVLLPNDRIYLIPAAQANDPTWHYIDTITNEVVSYVNDAITIPVNNAYFAGVVTDNGRVYLIPNQQADEPIWHYINLGMATIKFEYTSHMLSINDHIYIEKFKSTNSQIDTYLNRKEGLVVGDNTNTNEIFLNPMIDIQHNTIKMLQFTKRGTYSPVVDIIIAKNRFFANMRFRTLAEKETNKIVPV